MEDCQESEKTGREQLLDRGYHALERGSWEEAKEIFEDLLSEDPAWGPSCLGMALAKRQLHGRQDLAACWQQLEKDPDFLAELHGVEPGFLRWLRQDMEAAAPAPGPDGPHRVLYGFAGVQVGLYLLAALVMSMTQEESPGFLVEAAVCLGITAVMIGLPVILGPLYGNAILRESRFCRVLQILNNLVSLLMGGFYAIITLMGFLSLREPGQSAPGDRCYSFVVLIMTLICLISLILPKVLRWMKEAGQTGGEES